MLEAQSGLDGERRDEAVRVKQSGTAAQDGPLGPILSLLQLQMVLKGEDVFFRPPEHPQRLSHGEFHFSSDLESRGHILFWEIGKDFPTVARELGQMEPDFAVQAD